MSESTMLLQLGHSPDPDDAFMFYALAKDKIDTGRYRFNHVLQDIQTLNQRAMRGELEITAISIHAYPYVAGKYALTSCGSSMGDKYGPMIVSYAPIFGNSGLPQAERVREALRGKTIAIPGKLTSAFLTLQLLLGKDGEAFQSVVVPFDEIPQYILDRKADAGLLIHEGQLTYKRMGLYLLLDLGVWWFETTGLPLPLGGNCIRKDLGQQTMQEVTDILKRSIQYSLDHRAEAVEYALQFGRDLDRETADRFVGMYVNNWTLDYGPRGRQAISRLLQDGARAGFVPDPGQIEFVTAK